MEACRSFSSSIRDLAGVFRENEVVEVREGWREGGSERASERVSRWDEVR